MADGRDRSWAMGEAGPAGEAPPRLSVIVVNYNTRDLVLKALETLYAATRNISFETILVDNASRDESVPAIAAAFPQVDLIASPDNLGFAKANNLAAKRARGEWILLLNPDTETFEGSIEKLVAFGEANPQGGIYGGRTLFADGSVNIASCWGRPTPWSVLCRSLGLSSVFRRSTLFDPESMGKWDRDSVREADIIVGCFLLIRRSLWTRLGGFDERYWMYSEDADLCLRAREIGYRPLITPDAVIIHHVGRSAPTRADRIVMMNETALRLFRRHWSAPFRPLAPLLLLMGTAIRAVGTSLLAKLRPSRFAPSAEQWREVWRRRREWVHR